MIRPTAKTRCCICGKRATRTAQDEFGFRLDLCQDCPSPQDIKDRSAEVREAWDETEHRCREFQCRRPAVDSRIAVRYDQPTAVVTWGGLKLD